MTGKAAMSKEEKNENDNQDETVKGGVSMMKIIIIALLVSLVVGGATLAGTYVLVGTMVSEQIAALNAETGEEEEDVEIEAEPLEPPQYFPMDPKFVVSFNDQQDTRFMQFSLEVMTRDSEVLKQLEAHMPAIRSSLLMLFGAQSYEQMVTREGKEKLLTEVTEDINTSLQKILGQQKSSTAVEAAYFDSFIIQ